MQLRKLSGALAFSTAIIASGCAAKESTPAEGIPSQEELAVAAEARATNSNRPIPWWREYGIKSKTFYLSDEARQMADNMLTWQNDDGGWPLMTTWREPKGSDNAGPWGSGSALVKSTVNEIRFLARLYSATQDERYKRAAVKGIDFIIESQYDNGSWPHSVSARNDYDPNAGYNDDEIPDLIYFEMEALRSADFAFLDEQQRARLKESYESALDFVLNTQIVVDGKRTAWAQQYDHVTLEPASARAFEPVAISGGESAQVLLTLMDVRNPSDEIKQAIEAGVKWYRDVQIDGLRYQRGDGDSSVVPDPSAPPLWARFYDIETMRPIFAGRDAVIRDNLADIEKERRGGYAYYNYSGTKVFQRYEEWKLQREWDDPPKTNIDESKVQPYVLPDILTTQAGQAVSDVETWETVRRPEIMELLAAYQQGRTPETNVEYTFNVLEKDVPSLDGLAKRTQVRIEFPGHDADDLRIRVLLLTPADAAGPVPTLTYLSFTPAVMSVDEPGIDEDMGWSGALRARVPDRDASPLSGALVKPLLENGYGMALVYYGDIYPDFDHGNAEGVTRLFGGDGNPREPDEWGAIGA